MKSIRLKPPHLRRFECSDAINVQIATENEQIIKKFLSGFKAFHPPRCFTLGKVSVRITHPSQIGRWHQWYYRHLQLNEIFELPALICGILPPSSETMGLRKDNTGTITLVEISSLTRALAVCAQIYSVEKV
jgi:hypothetical protein